MTIKVICDFDGTVTSVDTTDAILERFAPPAWEEVEREWLDGRITSRECMDRQVAMLRVSRPELDEFIDSFDLTPGFREFAGFCEANDLNLCIVSDGIDYTILRVLTNHGLTNIPVIANHLILADGGYRLTFPAAREGCRFGLCKCAAADVANGRTVLIGDSHSDTCIAGKAATVYARRGKALAAYCALHGIEPILFDDFFAILAGMEQSIHLEGRNDGQRPHGRKKPAGKRGEVLFLR